MGRFTVPVDSFHLLTSRLTPLHPKEVTSRPLPNNWTHTPPVVTKHHKRLKVHIYEGVTD